MNRRNFTPRICTATLAAAGLLAMQGLSCFATTPAQNVLFIAIDDLKPWLGCYDHPVIKTPNIDRIAEMGTVFRRNYCQVALCGPTRMSLLTGLRPDTTQVYNMGSEIYHINTARKRAPQLTTLPGHFKENGYYSIGFGKVFDSRSTGKGQDLSSWSNPEGVRWEWDPSLFPTQPTRGGYQSPETREKIKDGLAEAKKRGLTKKREINDFLSTIEGTRPVCESLDVPDEAYSEGNSFLVPGVREIHRFGENKQPFFLAIGFYKPHLPFVAPKKYWDLYSPEDFELATMQEYPADSPSIAATDYVEARSFHPVPKEGPIPEELQRHMMHGYAACVSYVDAQVGKLLQALEEEGLMENTVICVWGDHGFHLGDKQVWGKHTNFEEATRSPLIIASPTIPGGQVVDETFTEFVDVFPTLCELTGLESPQGLDGKSLIPLMRGQRPITNEPAVSQYLRNTDDGLVMGWAIRTSHYRYVEWRRVYSKDLRYTFTGEILGRELYDYKTDPNETRNWINNPEHKEVLANLTRQFDEALPHLPERN